MHIRNSDTAYFALTPPISWSLNGNTGLNSTAYLGTSDSTDFVLKSNGQPQLVLKKEGGVEVSSNLTVMGQVRMPNLQTLSQPNELSLLVQGPNGNLATMQAGDLILRHQPSCELNDVINGSWFSPTIIDNNNNGAVIQFPERIMLDHAFTKFGLGLTCTEAPTEQLHVKGNQLLDGEIEISGSRLHVDKETGNVGIGTNSPGAKLEVSLSGEYTTGLQMKNDNNSLFFVPRLGGSGYSSLSKPDDAGLFWNKGTGNSGNAGLVIAPHHNSANGIRIDANGNVGVGTNTPEHKFEVCGEIRANKIIVEEDWCDYVFEEGYELITIDSLKAYVMKEKHLPLIPNENSILINGLDIGEIVKFQMLKIEELTLYIIKLNEMVKSLDK